MAAGGGVVSADLHQRAHLARLAAVQSRLQGLSDRALERHLQQCKALYDVQEALYPGTHPVAKKQQTPAWFHWRYGVSGALVKEIVEAQRELKARAAEQRDTGILRNAPQRSVLG